MLLGEYGRFGYSCADNIKVKLENMEESQKPCINLEAQCVLFIGQAFHYSPENAFYIFNQQIYFII